MKKILLIDDSDTYTWCLQKYLQHRGYPVKTACTLKEARAAIQEEMPLVVCCNLDLPDGSGMDFLNEVRAADIATVTAILEKELSVALGMSLPLFQLEAKQKKDKDRLKTQMSARRQETEKKRRLIRGLYENFVQGILTNEEYFELKADYEESIRTLSGEIEALEKDMDALDSRLVRYRAMEKDAKSLTQDHALTAELIDRLIERIEIDHERNIHVTFRFKSEFQGKAVEPCTKNM